jgi:hypothetical protein
MQDKAQNDDSSEIGSQPEVDANVDDANIQSQGVPVEPLPTINWSASEYVEHEKGATWYMALFGGGLIFTLLIFLIARDILASIVVLFSFMAIAVYAGRKPETKNYSVGENGVEVGEKAYYYADFKSFSVVEEGGIDSIWLKRLKRFSPPVVMYFSPDDADKIIDVISNFLPHEEHELDAVDRLTKRVRF